MEKITNQTGTFYLDENGRLVHYDNVNNCIGRNDRIDLIIPEGIQELFDHAFGGYNINYLKLPSSLKTIDITAFSGTHISNVELPEKPDRDMMRQLAHALRFGFSWKPKKLVHDWPAEYADIYLGKSETLERWTRLTNSSGTFLLDSDSVLMDFQPSKENLISQSALETHLEELEIPVNVKMIPAHALKYLSIQTKISFPYTLKWIGFGAFHRCRLPDLILPNSLELLAPSVFGSSLIRSLTISKSLNESCLRNGSGRRFKDNQIFEIRVPLKYREALLNICDHKRCSYNTTGEISNTEFGTLFYVRSEGASMGWGSDIERLFREMLKADIKINEA